MYNIRIKSLPENAKTGAQLNYALVDRNTLFLKPDMSVKQDVKKTESAVPREEAKIEAEGGEFHLSSTPDGYLKLMKILGNSHAKGGVPLDANPGDYIYSRTPSLAIKDPEVLAMFGIGGKNPKSYTPADLVNRYNNLNEYVSVLKDPKADAYSKNTADLMLKNYIDKLGQIALIQEGQKGFPEGIPAIAEMAAANLQQQGQPGGPPQGEQQVAKYGGTSLQVYQTKGQVPTKTNNLPPNTKKKLLTKKKEEGFWDNRGMPSGMQVLEGIVEGLDTPSKLQVALATTVNAGVHGVNPFTGKGMVSGKVIRDAQGNTYGTKYMMPSQLPQNRHLSKTAKIALDLATDPLNYVPLGFGAAKLATKSIAKAGAEAARIMGKDIVKTTLKKNVTNEVAEAVLKAAGKSVTPRNMATAKGAVAGASKKGVKYLDDTATALSEVLGKGSRSGAAKGVIGYDTRHIAKAGEAIYEGGKKVVQVIKDTPFKEIPKVVAKAAVAGAKATAKGVAKVATTPEILYPVQAVSRAAVRGVPEQEVKITPQEKLNQTDVALGLPEVTYAPTADTVTAAPVTPVTITPQNSAEANPETRNRLIEENKRMREEKEAKRVAELNRRAEYVAQQRAAQAAQRGNVTPVTSAPAEVPYSILKEEKYGGVQYGDLDKYQTDGTVKPTPVGTAYDSKRRKNIITWSDGNVTEEEPNISYDLADRGWKDIAEKNKYKIRYHKSAHTNRSSVPAQTRKTGFGVGAESGFYENKDYPIGAQGLADFIDLWKPELEQYSGPSGQGIDAWKKDLFAQKGEAGPASKYIVNKANALSYVATGRPQVDITQEDAYNPGSDVFNLGKPEKEPEVPEKPEEKPIAKAKIPPVTPPVRNDWWLQDKVNLAGIMGDRVRKFGPTMGHYDYRTPDYALEDPAMLNQLNLSAMGKYQEGLYGSTAGNIAGATAAANIGEGMVQAAKDQSMVQNRNVGTLNSVSAQAAQMVNQGELVRHEDRKQYAIDSAVAQQQYENARRNLKWQQIAALNQGITGYQRRNEQLALTPNSFIHPDTGEVSVINPAQMFDEDYNLAYNPYAASAAGYGGYDSDAWYDEYEKQGLTPENAERRANTRAKLLGIQNAARGKKGASPYGYGASPYGFGYGSAPFNPFGAEEQG